MSRGRTAEPTTDRGSDPTGRQRATARVRNPGAGDAQPKCAEPESEKPTSGHPLLQLQEKQGNQAVQQVVKEQIYPKLAVGRPNDRYEREADRVAKQVMRMSEPVSADGDSDRPRSNSAPPPTLGTTDRQPMAVARTSPGRVQRVCSRCERRASRGKSLNCPECEEELRRKESSGTGQLPKVDDETAREISSHRGRGDPLSRSTRKFFEPRFGYDLGGISVHTGSRATELNRSLDARAFTVGRDIFFRDGAYQPDSVTGRQLLAHELTHTVQQGAVRSLRTNQTATTRSTGANRSMTDGLQYDTAQRQTGSVTADTVNPALPAVTSSSDPTMVQRVSLPSLSDIETGIESVGEDVAEAGEDLVEWGSETAASALEAGEGALEWGEEMLVEIGGDVVGVASDVWDAVHALAEELGATVSFSGGRLVVSIPALPACPTIPIQFTLSKIAHEGTFLEGILPITGTVNLTGSVGYHLGLTPEILGQVGPCELQSTQIVVDPLGREYSTSGQLAVTLALGLGAEVRVGLEGEVGMLVIIPAEPPIPLEFPVVGLEGGLAGMARGTLADRVTIGGSLAYANGNISFDASRTEDLGIGLDLGLAGYGQLELLGNNLCRLYWPFWQRHYDATMSTLIDAHLALGRGGVDASLNVAPPQFDTFPFSDFGLELRREAFMDECPICEKLREFGLLPSQIGGPWPYHPTKPWQEGPLSSLPVYPRDPKLASEALCRGACGLDCRHCRKIPRHVITETDGNGQLVHWLYPEFRICGADTGCREHDACYDWAATKGELGFVGVLLGPLHRLCDLECLCDYSLPTCVGWALGEGGRDTMYFSDKPGTVDPSEEQPDEAGAQTEEETDPIEDTPSGSTPNDPIPMVWYKRPSDYPRAVVLEGEEVFRFTDGPRQYFLPDPGVLWSGKRGASTLRQHLEPGFSVIVGVDQELTPKEGRVWKKIRSYRKIFYGRIQEAFRFLMIEHGHDMKGRKEDADHVKDLQFAGPDDFHNMWPLNEGVNRSAWEFGKQSVTYVDDDGNLQTTTLDDSALLNRWFEIVGFDHF